MPAIPKGASVPEDHKKPAVQIEAEGIATTEVSWRGHTFSVASDPDDWTVATLLAFEEGKVASGLRGLLGPKQWAELMATNPRNRDLSELSEVMAPVLGLGDSAGE